MRRRLAITLPLVVVLLLGATNSALSMEHSSQPGRTARAQVLARPDLRETKKCENKENSRACQKRKKRQDAAEAGVAYDKDSSGYSTVAEALVPAVAVYPKRSAPAPSQTLENPSPVVGDPNVPPVPLILLVKHRAGDWVQVFLPGPPNGGVGWVKSGDVSLAQSRYRILVNLGERRITVLDGKSVLLRGPAAVGAPATPTPTGVFYVRWGFEAPSYALVVNAYNAEGIPNGITGTNDPARLGTEVTSGSVEISNDAITRLSSLIYLGTVVEIV